MRAVDHASSSTFSASRRSRQADFVHSVSAREAQEAGREATLLPVGELAASLVFGDEIYRDVRPIQLAWSDGETDWTIRGAVGRVEATLLVDMARSMYCGH